MSVLVGPLVNAKTFVKVPLKMEKKIFRDFNRPVGHSETESDRRKENNEVRRGPGVVSGAAAGCVPPLISNEEAKAACQV